METLAPFSSLHRRKLCVVLYHFHFLPMYTVPFVYIMFLHKDAI